MLYWYAVAYSVSKMRMKLAILTMILIPILIVKKYKLPLCFKHKPGERGHESGLETPSFKRFDKATCLLL